MISGTHRLRRTEEDLELAKHRIVHDYSFVGLVERFDDCLAVLARQWGWTAVGDERRNVGDRSRPELLPDGAREAFAEANRLDIALYEWFVRERLDTVIRPGALVGVA